MILLKEPSIEKALLTLHCNDRTRLTSEKSKKYHAWSCQNVCDALIFLLDNISIWFGTQLYRHVVGIPMGNNCAPLVADLFLFCYERDLMMSLSGDKQADTIDAFDTTSRYLDDILNIDNAYFDSMVSQIYPSELQLNRANTSDTEFAFLDLHLSISNDIVSTKIYDKRRWFWNFQFSIFSWWCFSFYLLWKIVSEYDQEIPQSQTADNPVAPRGRAAQPSQDTRILYLSTHSFC